MKLAGQYQAMYCMDQTAVDPSAPARAELKEFNFPEGAVSGQIVWDIPSVTEGGTPLSGDIDYSVTLDGTDYTTGKTTPGSDLKVKFKDLTQATHTFKITLETDGKAGRALTTSRYVGNDTPKAPASVSLTESLVSWDAVTEGLHLGYLDLDALRYNVRLNGVTIAEGIESTSCPTGLEPGTPIDNYVAEVEAVCNGMTSSSTSSNAIIFGDALTLPVALTPTEQEASLFTVIDSNDDEYSWEFETDDDHGDCFMYHYSYKTGDDWLILPPFKVEDTKRMLYFAMEYAAKAANMPEDFEVMIGTSPDPEAMTTILLDRYGVSNTAMETADKYFTLPEAGEYYIGIHAMSQPDMFYLFVKNFIIEQSDITLNGPAAVTDLKSESGESGALEATVSFVMPSTTIAGTALSPEAKITATVQSGVDKKTVEGTPGSTQSVKISTEQGVNSISIQTECEGNKGAVARVSVYTGIDIPGIPSDISISVSENNCSARISWSAPKVGENGGYVSPTGILYYLCQYTMFGWMPVGEIGTDVFEYTVEVPEGSPLERYDIGILCENEAGTGSYLATVHPVLGQPFTLPATEKFEDGFITYQPVSIGGDAEVELNVSEPSELGGEYEGYSGYAITGICEDKGTSEIFLPKFSTKGLTNAAFEISLFMHPGVKIYAEAFGVPKTLLTDISHINHIGYQTISCPLPAEMQDNGWVTFSIVTDYSQGDTFVMTGYRIRNLVDHDLSVSLSGTNRASIGEKMHFVATITNEGTEPTNFKGGRWTVKNGDIILAETDATGTGTLNPDQKVTVEFDAEANADYIGDVTVEFTINGKDGDESNNSGSMRVSVSRGEAAVVTDLETSASDNGILLTWSAPLGKPVEDSFEEETPFVLSPEKIGAFENIDRDGGEVYTWENGDQVWDGAGKPGAFSVFSASQLDEITGEEGLFEAADGDRFLIAFCPVPISEGGTADKADDWLISPECEGGSDFSFSLRCMTEQYGDETLEVLVAEDASDPDNFTLLDEISICEDEEWVRFSFRLPADARYFAIRYTSEDIYAIMLDAIEFQPAGTTMDVKGYDVWRSLGSTDFEKIASVELPGYNDTETDGSRKVRYYVVPILNDDSCGERSNIAEVNMSGVEDISDDCHIRVKSDEIILSGFNGKHYVVSNVSGITVAKGVASECESISVIPGIYLINVDGRRIRVLVR